MSEYIYSPGLNMICAVALKADYELAGTWPADAVGLDDATALEFMRDAPSDSLMAAGPDGLPVWKSAPPLTAEQLEAQAERRRASLIAEAQDTISIWQTKLMLGRISNDEKASLNAWLDYIDTLTAMNIADVQEDGWPGKPA